VADVLDTLIAQERFFVFRVSDHLFALPLAVVREVAPYCALSRPPSLPGCVEGLLNLRGQAVPVIRLDRLLFLAETSPCLESVLLILQRGAETVALLVDRAVGIRAVEADQTSPLAPGSGCAPCVSAQASLPEGTALLLSPELLLLTREQEVLSHLRDVEQERLAAIEGRLE